MFHRLEISLALHSFAKANAALKSEYQKASCANASEIFFVKQNWLTFVIENTFFFLFYIGKYLDLGNG